MQVCRPVFCIELIRAALTVIAESGDIVAERIEPYINDVLVIKIYRNAPFKGGSGYAKILQSRKKEIVHHLVLAGYGLDKLGVCIDMLDQTVCIFAHSEEISFLLGRLYLSAAVRTLAVHKLCLCPEGLTRSTVHSFIGTFVDIALLVELFKNLLHFLLMIIICCTDKLIIGDVEHIADVTNLSRNLVHKFLRSHTGLLGL